MLNNIAGRNKNKMLHSPLYLLILLHARTGKTVLSMLAALCNLLCLSRIRENTQQFWLQGSVAYFWEYCFCFKMQPFQVGQAKTFLMGQIICGWTYPLQFKVLNKVCVWGGYFLGKLIHTLEDLQCKKYFWYEAIVLLFSLWNVCMHGKILVKKFKMWSSFTNK